MIYLFNYSYIPHNIPPEHRTSSHWSGVVVSALASINKVNLRQARLVLRWAFYIAVSVFASGKYAKVPEVNDCTATYKLRRKASAFLPDGFRLGQRYLYAAAEFQH